MVIASRVSTRTREAEACVTVFTSTSTSRPVLSFSSIGCRIEITGRLTTPDAGCGSAGACLACHSARAACSCLKRCSTDCVSSENAFSGIVNAFRVSTRTRATDFSVTVLTSASISRPCVSVSSIGCSTVTTGRSSNVEGAGSIIEFVDSACVADSNGFEATASSCAGAGVASGAGTGRRSAVFSGPVSLHPLMPKRIQTNDIIISHFLIMHSLIVQGTKFSTFYSSALKIEAGNPSLL